jgi:hypothetical protein
MPCRNILAGKSPAAQQFAIFNRIVPNFSFELLDIDSDHLENIEMQSWYKKISADKDFIRDINSFINSEKTFALAFINVKIKQITSVIIYLILRNKNNTIELKFFNLIEIATLISNGFKANLWTIISNQIEKEHLEGRILKRNFEASFFALRPLFTMCHTNFNALGKSKYSFGDTLFYFNDKRKWDRKNNTKPKENSGRVALYSAPLNNEENKNVYSQALISCKLENNILLVLK